MGISSVTINTVSNLTESKLVSTTDSTPTDLANIQIDVSSTTFISAFVVARCTGGSAGTVDDGLGFMVQGVFKITGGQATSVGQSLPTITKDKLGWDVYFTTTSNMAVLKVIGATNTNIDWKVKYELIKL